MLYTLPDFMLFHLNLSLLLFHFTYSKNLFPSSDSKKQTHTLIAVQCSFVVCFTLDVQPLLHIRCILIILYHRSV